MKNPYDVKSIRKCLRCNNTLKQNLIDKKPHASLCYKCHRISLGKPAQHVPRQSRISAALTVHYSK